jgi:hypothetical protein
MIFLNAASAVTKEFRQAASIHITGFLKAARDFKKISVKTDKSQWLLEIL